MTKEIINNLEILRAAVEEQPENLFDLGSFKSVEPCGTLFCTLGLACTMPHFQAMGFSLVKYGGGTWYNPKLNGNYIFEELDSVDDIFGDDSFLRLFELAGGGIMDFDLGFDADYEDYYNGSLDPQNMSDKTLALKRLDRQINIYKGEQA